MYTIGISANFVESWLLPFFLIYLSCLCMQLLFIEELLFFYYMLAEDIAGNIPLAAMLY